MYDKNFSSEQWFRDAKEGRFYTSADGAFTGTVVEHLYVDESVKEVYRDEGLALGFTSPVYDADKNVIAVWKNVAKFSLVEEVFQSTYRDLKRRNLASAELTLLDESGNVIVDYDPSTHGSEDVTRDMNVIGKLNLAQEGVEAAEKAVGGTAGALTSSYHARKQTHQCAGFAPLTGALGFPGMKWSVLVRVNCSEALASSNWLKTMVLALSALILVVVSASATFVSRRLTRPIRRTVETLATMAEGDLTQTDANGIGR